MKNDNYKIAECPSCQCRYQVLQNFIGHKVSCKKCGVKFTIEFNEEDAKNSPKIPLEKGKFEKISQEDSYLFLGKLAIKYDFISKEQLRDALAIQAGLPQEEQCLGTIFVAKEMISQAQLDFLNSTQKIFETRKLDNKFGTIAVCNNFATQAQIDWALQEQNMRFKKTKRLKLIGDILIESKVMTKSQRDTILLRQKRFKENSPAETTPLPPLHFEEERKKNTNFSLSVSMDKLFVTLCISDKANEPVTIEEIKQCLQMKGIKHGIVTDSEIAMCLTPENNNKEPQIIAKGVKPHPPKNATIKYYFDTDPLKVGKIKKGGTIDFKDKGDFPKVTTGNLLAQKDPAVEGIPGKDVLGCEIPVSNPQDLKLRSGTGTVSSQDNLKIVATTDGIPEISAMGKVYVSPELKIFGDVCMETGHINFNGKIHVLGSIQNGYCVQGNSLTAREILKSEIKMAGDIIVNGGIIGAEIKTDGNIQAKYIRGSHIEAFGNVVVENEIIDSQIATGGQCLVNEGPILSSKVAAKKGICAMNIGSEISKPCNLIVGVDKSVKRKTEQIKTIIPQKTAEIKELITLRIHLMTLPEKIEKKIGSLVQILDRATVKQRELKKIVEALDPQEHSDQLTDLGCQLKEVILKIAEDEKNLEDLFNEQDHITAKISNNQKDITSAETELNEIKNKLEEITEWSSREMGIPEVVVKATIFANTTITGMYSSLSIKQNRHKVLIKEEGLPGAGEHKTGTNSDKLERRITIRPL